MTQFMFDHPNVVLALVILFMVAFAVCVWQVAREMDE